MQLVETIFEGLNNAYENKKWTVIAATGDIYYTNNSCTFTTYLPSDYSVIAYCSEIAGSLKSPKYYQKSNDIYTYNPHFIFTSDSGQKTSVDYDKIAFE